MELYSYVNGNVNVTLYGDGTKRRSYEGIPAPEHPESIDVKITNNCDLTCNWCHEMSGPRGKHANLDTLQDVLSPLPAGVELAIGGGNPLLHPNLHSFLSLMAHRGLVCNMTVNSMQLDPSLYTYISDGLIKGLGLSVRFDLDYSFIGQKVILYEHTVLHIIAGLDSIDQLYSIFDNVRELRSSPLKVLILGYKDYGRGASYKKEHKIYLNEWYRNIGKILQLEGIVLSFDNLALEQLNVKRFFSEEKWQKFYMGEDGKYTMYIDGVREQYAKSSTSLIRTSFEDMPLLKYFKDMSTKQHEDNKN